MEHKKNHEAQAAKIASQPSEATELTKELQGVPSAEEAKGAQEVAKIPEQAKSITVNAYADDAGEGLENISSDELLIPFIRILQGLSPEVDEAESKHIPDAKPGQMFNTATQELFDGTRGILFLPVRRTHTFGEFTPRLQGGGFHGVWDESDARIPALRAAQGGFGKLALENGNELIETYSIYGLVAPMLLEGEKLEDTAFSQVVIGFSSTQIRAYRLIIARLNTLMGQPKPVYPIFAHLWHFCTVGQKNAKGKFHGWQPRLYGGSAKTALLPVTSDLYQQGKAFSAFLKEGKAKADFGQTGADAAATEGDEEIPF
jgi:hypothetical protein